MIIDSFSGELASLKPRERTTANALRVLSHHPRVSTWDMSESAWLRDLIRTLIKCKLIAEKPEPYPWHRYELTDAGMSVIAGRLVTLEGE